jgi:hypothetical protein
MFIHIESYLHLCMMIRVLLSFVQLYCRLKKIYEFTILILLQKWWLGQVFSGFFKDDLMRLINQSHSSCWQNEIMATKLFYIIFLYLT